MVKNTDERRLKSLGKQEDVKSTRDAAQRDERHFLKIPDQKTPWYLLSLEYADGFVHWYETPTGDRRRLVCGSTDPKKHGFDPDNCPLCALVLEYYQAAKEAEAEGDIEAAKKLRNKGNDLRSKQETQFKAIRGNRVIMKNQKTGQKEAVADWDVNDEDSQAEAGTLGLSSAQFESLTGLINGESTPFIESGNDLGNRVLWTSKERRKNKRGTKYSAVVWTADEHPSKMPDFEVPDEVMELDLAENFELDPDELIKVRDMLLNSVSEGEDESVAMEAEDAVDETAVEDEPNATFLDDVEEDEEEDIYEQADAEDDDFEDDIPYEEDEEEEEAPPKQSVRAGKPVANTRKGTPTGSQAGKQASGGQRKRSGKVRL